MPTFQVFENLLTGYIDFFPVIFARVIFFLFIPPQKHSGKFTLPSGLQNVEGFLSTLKRNVEQGNIALIFERSKGILPYYFNTPSVLHRSYS